MLSALPVADPNATEQRIVPAGDVPSPINPPAGCSFHPRCPWAEERCRVEVPELIAGRGGHAVACHVFPAKRTED